MNWRELKDFCINLPESELEKNVILWRENAEDVITDINCSTLSDQYIDKENKEDGCFDFAEADWQIRNNPEDYPNGIEHFEKVYSEGHPILFENF